MDCHSAQPPTNQPALRLMVVDDDTDNADLLAKVLGKWGYSARVAYTGSFSLKLAAEFKPDVFLVDLGMRNMDGYRLAEHIRLHPSLADSTLIAVTGYGDQSHRTRAEEAGFAQFFVKPVDLAVLKAALCNIDERRRDGWPAL